MSALSLLDTAAWVSGFLMDASLDVVLTGSACVAIHTHSEFQTGSIDFVNARNVSKKRLHAEMLSHDFIQKGREFQHPQTPFQIHFLPGPLSISAEPVGRVMALNRPSGTLRLLSPLDCVKDRLTEFFLWRDEVCLEQASAVLRHQSVNEDDVLHWVSQQSWGDDFQPIKSRLFSRKEGR